MLSYQYAKFKENPCMGTDVSTPFLAILMATFPLISFPFFLFSVFPVGFPKVGLEIR